MTDNQKPRQQTTQKPWVAEYEAWKAKRQPHRSEEDLLHEIYCLERRVAMWRDAGLQAKDYILKSIR